MASRPAGMLISQRRADRLVSETRHVLSQSRYLGVLRPGEQSAGKLPKESEPVEPRLPPTSGN